MTKQCTKSDLAIEPEQLDPPPDLLGLHQVYPDINRDSQEDMDVVFVHGLGGSAYATWTKKSKGPSWIQSLLPKSSFFKNTRVMTFGYRSSVFLKPLAKKSGGRVFTFAEDLLSDLKVSRITPESKRRPIMFLAHSMGGIIVKDALRHARMLPDTYGDILDATKAIVFFGTPHQGSDPAAWATYLGGVGRVVGIRSHEVVDDLKRWSNTLIELTAQFAEMWERFNITTFYETRPTHGVMIVPEGSARTGQRNEQSRSLAANHIELCKFSKEDPNWHTVLQRLEAVAWQIRETETSDIMFERSLQNLQEPPITG